MRDANGGDREAMRVNTSALIPIGDTRPAVPATGFDLLTGPQTQTPKESDASVEAQQVFLSMYGEEPTSGVGVGAHTLDRRKKVFHLLMAFCSQEEKKLLRSRKADDEGERRVLAAKLERYFGAFVASIYLGHEKTVPQDLQRALPESASENICIVGHKRPSRGSRLKPFKVSTYENRNKDLQKNLKFVLTKNHRPDRKLLQAWRKTFDETGQLRLVTPADSLSTEGGGGMDAFVERTGRGD